MLREPLPRPGPWTSKELGIPYPYIHKIYIGRCGSREPNHGIPDGTWNTDIQGGAHTHCCPNDPANGMVCFYTIDYLYDWRNKNGASSTYWHEYAHLIENGQGFPCPCDKNVYLANFDAIQKGGHGPLWKSIMRAMGQHVPVQYYDTFVEYAMEEYRASESRRARQLTKP